MHKSTRYFAQDSCKEIIPRSDGPLSATNIVAKRQNTGSGETSAVKVSHPKGNLSLSNQRYRGLDRGPTSEARFSARFRLHVIFNERQ